MKELKCYDCDMSFKATSREEILGILYNHYMQKHRQIITGVNEKEKRDWMKKFEKHWKLAVEVKEA